MYFILETPRPKSDLTDWEEAVCGFDLIKAYNCFGDCYLINSESNEIAILSPLNNLFDPMGYYSWDKFYTSVLSNEEFQEKTIGLAHLEKVIAHAGELGPEEIYIPEPYPFIGGSDEPQTYAKGNLWIFLTLTAQAWEQI